MQRVGEANPDLQVVRANRARGARAIVVGGLAPAEGRARSTGGIHRLECAGKPPSVMVNAQKPDGKHDAERRGLSLRLTHPTAMMLQHASSSIPCSCDMGAAVTDETP